MGIENLIIQTVTPSDAQRLAELAEKTFREAFARSVNKADFEHYVAQAFTEAQMRSELADPANTFFAAGLSGRWVGYAKLHEGPAPDCVRTLPAIELSRLYAVQAHLGGGVGPALMAACIDHARGRNFKAVWLASWQQNHRGNAFYAKMKFEIAGTQTFTLGSEIQDDYILARSIS